MGALQLFISRKAWQMFPQQDHNCRLGTVTLCHLQIRICLIPCLRIAEQCALKTRRSRLADQLPLLSCLTSPNGVNEILKHISISLMSSRFLLVNDWQCFQPYRGGPARVRPLLIGLGVVNVREIFGAASLLPSPLVRGSGGGDGETPRQRFL